MTPVQRALVLLAVRADATVPGATSVRRSIWYGLMMVDRFWETILYWQGMQQCTVVWWYCDVFTCFLCDIYVWPCDWCASDIPGLQDIILAKLGAEFLEPPPFNLEKAMPEKKITGKFPKIGFRPSKKRTSNENSPWIRDVFFFTYQLDVRSIATATTSRPWSSCCLLGQILWPSSIAWPWRTTWTLAQLGHGGVV
jgi:hypothetical protein